MKKLFKPYSFLFYLLTVLVFFVLGAVCSSLMGAAKNQGLAGGAIVFGYGVISAFFAFLASLIVVYKTNGKTIIILNKILALILAGFMAYFTWNYYYNIKPRHDKQKNEIRKLPTKPTDLPPETSKPSAMLLENKSNLNKDAKMSLGMFAPNLFDNEALYFYGSLNLEKSLLDHSPIDSITFKRTEYGNFNIATAPPWLYPEMMKLDYDILFFKVISITEDFLEVEVNKSTKQTSHVDRRAGNILYWPDFLLSVNSVEFLDKNSQRVYLKPVPNASIVNRSYSFMKPLKISNNWMYVLLLNDGFEPAGKGWIKWHDDEKLIIRYSLLS